MMDAASFRKLSSIAYRGAGICIKEGKEALVAARVARRQRALGIDSPRRYVDYLQADESGEELIHYLDVISTNYTSFYREREHFEYLERQLASWLGAGMRELRLWCAAASTGEEPYSLAMSLSALAEQQPFSYRLLATDISTRVLAQAKAGRYSERSLAPLSKAQRVKYFTRLAGDVGELCYQVKPCLSANVVFARLNLVEVPYPMRGPFDVILCRNVMIYFDTAVRQQLVCELERLLKPGGLLFIGHAETLTGLRSRFKMLMPSVFVG